MKLLLGYLYRHKWVVALALLMAIINQGAAFIDPLITGKIVDQLINKRNTLTHQEFFQSAALLVGLAFAAVTVARLANNFQDAYTNTIVHKTGTDMFTDGLKHALALPYFEFTDQSSGQTLGQLTKVRTDVESFIVSFINVFFTASIGLVFVVVYSLQVNYKVTLLYLIAVPIIIFISWYLSRRLKPLQESILNKTSRLAGVTTESLHNIELVKSLGLAEEQTDHLSKTSYSILELEMLKIRLNRKTAFIQGTMVNAVRSIMIFILLFLIFNKELSAGQYFTFLLYSLFLFNPLQEVGKVLQSGREAQVSLTQFGELINKPFEKEPENPTDIDHINCIDFEDVGFAYPNKKGSIKNVSFQVKSGETIAFVGPSGSGKSTIIKLIMQLYTPTEGKISFNSAHANEFNKNVLRKKTGIVTQDTQLFSGSIRDNLLFVRPESSEDDCHEVLNRSACQQLMERAENDLSTMIGESGMKVSGGERQRLAIARALLRHPDILIFDEATSALDSITEREITDTIKQISEGGNHITLLVAHRLSTIKYAHRIYVLEKGSITETGSHEELLEKKGLYFAMWRQQIGEAEN